MKVHHQFARAFWDLHLSAALISDHNSTCKRPRPLVPQLSSSDATTVDLKAFIRPDGGPTKKDTQPQPQPQAETTSHQGGTRWNPTQEQIGILETLYRGGIRTPNAQQIEHITTQLSKYGKIEGKNVFYWFQNHKARERQKHKRSLPNSSSPPAHAPSSVTLNFDKSKEDLGKEGQIYSSCKRKCRTWTFETLLPGENIITEFTANGDDTSDKSKEEDEDLGDKKTLKLFPLHPEGRSMMSLSII